jgi:hypothetical protein
LLLVLPDSGHGVGLDELTRLDGAVGHAHWLLLAVQSSPARRNPATVDGGTSGFRVRGIE